MKHPFGKLLASWLLTNIIGTLFFILIITFIDARTSWQIDENLARTFFSFLIMSLPGFIVFYLIALRISSADPRKKNAILSLLALAIILITVYIVFAIAWGFHEMLGFLNFKDLKDIILHIILPFSIPFIGCVFLFDFSKKKIHHLHFDIES